MTQVGDRLEHAIEQHADIEQEIERGEVEQPPRKRLVRTVFWLAVTVGLKAWRLVSEPAPAGA